MASSRSLPLGRFHFFSLNLLIFTPETEARSIRDKDSLFQPIFDSRNGFSYRVRVDASPQFSNPLSFIAHQTYPKFRILVCP